MSLLSLIVGLLIICLLYWAVTRILAAFGVGDPISTVVQVVFVLIVVLWLMQSFGVISPLSIR